MGSLLSTSDCILPIENQSLYKIAQKILSSRNIVTSLTSQNSVSDPKIIPTTEKPKAFDTMNNIVANLLLNMTSSMRFQGSLNVDMNDIVTNLVPFPSLNCVSSAMTPLYTSADKKQRNVENLFVDAFGKDCQLSSSDVRLGTFLACALVGRGPDLEMSDLRRNIARSNVFCFY